MVVIVISESEEEEEMSMVKDSNLSKGSQWKTSEGSSREIGKKRVESSRYEYEMKDVRKNLKYNLKRKQSDSNIFSPFSERKRKRNVKSSIDESSGDDMDGNDSLLLKSLKRNDLVPNSKVESCFPEGKRKKDVELSMRGRTTTTTTSSWPRPNVNRVVSSDEENESKWPRPKRSKKELKIESSSARKLSLLSSRMRVKRKKKKKSAENVSTTTISTTNDPSVKYPKIQSAQTQSFKIKHVRPGGRKHRAMFASSSSSSTSIPFPPPRALPLPFIARKEDSKPPAIAPQNPDPPLIEPSKQKTQNTKTTKERKRKNGSVISTNFVRLNLKRKFRSGRKLGGSAKNRRIKEYKEKRRAEMKAQALAKNPMPLYQDEGEDALELCTEIMKKVKSTNKNSQVVVVPLCPGHQLPCTLRKVKKATSVHKGRKFYACCLPREQQCDAFFWFDAVDHSEAHRILQDTDTSSLSGDALCEARLAWFSSRIEGMTCFELKRELKRLGMKCSGKKADLQDRIRGAHKTLLTWLDDETRMKKAREGDPEALDTILSRVFGYEDWLPGQEESVTRVVKGHSLLLVLPTGGGKSLCYQLPALLGKGLTIVISPLLSLMMDQMEKLPAALCGGCIGSNQTSTEMARVIRAVRRGVLQVLFISPERLMSPRFQDLLNQIQNDRAHGAVSLVVVDEAHCVSQWSHNFRPSYLRLGKVIPKLCGETTPILALTATVTKCAIDHVQRILRLPSGNVYHRSWRRSNLHIRVCRTRDRIDALTRVLRSNRVPGIPRDDEEKEEEEEVPRWPCIVYVLHRAGCEMTAKVLRERGVNAEAYHGRLPSETRRRVQERFVNGSLRVVVATTAFGMGLDKSNVRAVIHYNMPRSVEGYVQEIGRAGRDGQDALCLLLLDDEDARRLLALTAADGIDRSHLAKLLRCVYLDSKNEELRLPREWRLSMSDAERSMDMSTAAIETLLVLINGLDTEEEKEATLRLQLCTPTYNRCKVKFYGQQHRAKQDNELVRHLVEHTKVQFNEKGILVTSDLERNKIVNLVSIAKSMHTSTDRLLSELRKLKKKGMLSYELCDKAIRALVFEEPQDENVLKRLETRLWNLTHEQRESQRRKIAHLYIHLARAASSSVDTIFDEKERIVDLEEGLCSAIDTYFEERVKDDRDEEKAVDDTEDGLRPEMSEYERKRMERIKQNEAAMRAMGLLDKDDDEEEGDEKVDENDPFRLVEEGQQNDDQDNDDDELNFVQDLDNEMDDEERRMRRNAQKRISQQREKRIASSKSTTIIEATKTVDDDKLEKIDYVSKAESLLYLEVERHKSHVRAELYRVLNAVRDMYTLNSGLENAFELTRARALARIAHGIPSPAFTRLEWNMSPCWGRLKSFSFTSLCEVASELLFEEDEKNHKKKK